MPTCSGHRDAGVIVKNVEVTSGEVFLNLNEELFYKRNSSYDTLSHANKANIDSSTLELAHQKRSPLLNITKSWFPEKVHGILMLSVLLGVKSRGIYLFIFSGPDCMNNSTCFTVDFGEMQNNQVGHLTNKNNL